MKARRAAETDEERAARKTKRAATFKADPEIERKRAEAISKTRLRRREKMSEAARVACAKKSPEARAASLANLELRDADATRKKRAETRKVPRDVRHQRKAEQAARDALPADPKRYRMREWTEEERRLQGEDSKARWAALTDEEYNALIEKRRRGYAKTRTLLRRTHKKLGDTMDLAKRVARLRRMQDGRRLKSYTLVNGLVEKFHSSWEAACADALIHAGIPYDPQVHLVLGDVSYFADFVVDDPAGGKVVIEVKGYYRAWDNKTLPALHRNLRGDWRVYLLDHKTRVRPASLREFLEPLTLVATGAPLIDGQRPTEPVTPETFDNLMASMGILIE